MSDKKITGCIVTFNNMNTIENTVSSVLKHTASGIELYCVDNVSSDSTPDFIAEKFPQVKVIRNSVNSGFGAAHTQIIDKLDSDYHVIINPDIILRDDVIGKMADYMDSHPEVGMLTPCIRFPDGTPQILGKRNPRLDYLVASRLRGKEPSKKLREYAMLDNDLTREFQVENATGCFMFIRTSLFKEIGGFDPRYFMYFEDCDLAREVNKRSKVMYFPGATVYHVWERASKKNYKLLKIHIKSMFAYFGKWGWN